MRFCARLVAAFYQHIRKVYFFLPVGATETFHPRHFNRIRFGFYKMPTILNFLYLVKYGSISAFSAAGTSCVQSRLYSSRKHSLHIFALDVEPCFQVMHVEVLVR